MLKQKAAIPIWDRKVSVPVLIGYAVFHCLVMAGLFLVSLRLWHAELYQQGDIVFCLLLLFFVVSLAVLGTLFWLWKRNRFEPIHQDRVPSKNSYEE